MIPINPYKFQAPLQLRLAVGRDELRHDLPQLLHVQGAARAAAGRLQQDHGVAHGGHGQLGGADDVLGWDGQWV